MHRETIQVLSVEDNAGDVRLIREMLVEATSLGWDLPRFELHHVTTLTDVLARLDEGDVDVVLSDLDLPDSQAGDTFAQIRAHAPHVPIVVLTGREDEALARQAVRAGAEDYLFKREMSGSLLAHALLYAIERQRNRAALQQAHDDLERKVQARTAELAQANEQLRQEVAERQKTEAELRASEKLLRTITANLPNTYLSIIEEDLTVGYTAGKEFARRGLDPDSFVGLTLEQVFGEHAPIVRKHYERTFAGEEVEFELGFGDQHQRYNVVPLVGEHGAIPRILAVVENITARKQAEEALQESEERFRLIAETSPDVLFQLDLEGQITYCSPAVERLLGLAPAEVVGTHFGRFFPAAGLAQAMANFGRAAAAERVEVVEAEILNEAGAHVAVEANLVPVVKDGQVMSVQGTVRDITARKHIETQIRHHTEQLATVVDIEHTLANSLDRHAICENLARGLQRLMPDAATIFVSGFDAERKMIVALYGLQDGEVIDVAELPEMPLAPPGAGTQSQVIRTRQPLVIAANLPEKLLSGRVVRVGSTDKDTQSALYVPMLAQDDVLGVIQLQSYVSYCFTEDDVRLLSLVANTAAVAIQNARLYEEAARRRR